jgi:predicted RNA-binding Zn-ribbon protein involved in translation (DUF1610 family)
MSNTILVCPKCGHERRQEDNGPEHECPRCGVIYDKFRSAQTRPAGIPPRKEVSTKSGMALPLWAKKAIPIALVLVVVLAAWGIIARSGPDDSDKASPVAIKTDAFRYPLQGTWTGSLQDMYPSQGNMPSYMADYEAAVIITDNGRIQEVRWTDSHTMLSRTTVTWQEGAVVFVGEERHGGNAEMMSEPMSEYLKVRHGGNGMTLSYNRPDNLELEISTPNALAGSSDQSQTSQQQADADSLTIDIPVRLVREENWDVPSKQISRIVLKAPLARSLWFLFPKNIQNELQQGNPSYGEYTGCVLPWIEIFSGGSAGVYFEFNLENVSIARAPADAMKTIDPESILRLEADSVMRLRAHAFERQALLRFTKDGQASLTIKDRRLQHSGQPLVFTLAKTG